MLTLELGIPAAKPRSRPLGGDKLIEARIADGDIDLLIFFLKSVTAQPHDPDVKAPLRIAVVWKIPLACDRQRRGGSARRASRSDSADRLAGAAGIVEGLWQRLLPAKDAQGQPDSQTHLLQIDVQRDILPRAQPGILPAKAH